MTSHNLKVAIEKGISILPTRLEILKLRNTLDPLEDDEYEKVIKDQEIYKQIVEEQKIDFERKVHREQDELLKKSGGNPFDALVEVLGPNAHKVYMEVMEEMSKEHKYNPFNTDNNTGQLEQEITKKLFSKVMGNDDMVKHLLDKTLFKDKNKGINDPSLK
jgi:hypothetical protein